ncbi:hypothetical protein EPO17_02305 [Patescibacteria group bacterium]|nr:MAG: hypothetical protein EPO17_02305 [Patescibacteria group bacterium]
MKKIKVETTIQSDLQKVWDMWTKPEHIIKWNQAASDWECPHAENDVRVGGKFLSTMSAKDGSASFDFSGTYTEVTPLISLAHTIEDGRQVSISFTVTKNGVHVIETFDPENINSEALQRDGWQAILDNFKKYVETY